MAPRRVFVTGLWHETNTFSTLATDLAAFRAYQYVEGEAMVAFSGTNTEIGGMLEAAPRLGFEVRFGLFAGAVPSGMVTAETYRHLVARTAALAAEARPVDGVLVALHGAMVAEDAPPAEAGLLIYLREVVGRDVPLVATFDIHANLARGLFDVADALIGYDTYPHSDMAARGREAAELLAEIMADRRPAKAFRRLPLLTVPQVQGTGDPPMREVIEELHRIEARPEVSTASIALGFPYADVAHLGVTVVAYGREEGGVERAADDLAVAIWRRRREFVPTLVPPTVAVSAALAAPKGPVILVDVADNVGGGAPGDGSVILRALLRARAEGAVIVLWAPAAVAKCRDLGVGRRFHGLVGGQTDDRHGPPVHLDGTIELARPVEYRRRSSYMTGQLVRLGFVAVVNDDGVRVVLTEHRVMPFDADHLRVLGIEPAEQRILVCKSAIGWRAAFGDVAQAHIFVDTPGICASDLRRFDYTRGQAELFPLNPDAVWPAEPGRARPLTLGSVSRERA